MMFVVVFICGLFDAKTVTPLHSILNIFVLKRSVS